MSLEKNVRPSYKPGSTPPVVVFPIGSNPSLLLDIAIFLGSEAWERRLAN